MKRQVLYLGVALVTMIIVLPITDKASGATTAKGSPALAGPSIPGWQQRWNETLAAAKKEGKVTVYGEFGPAARTGLSKTFKNRYGIEFEVVTGPNRAVISKYIQEVRNGVYLADVIFGGGSTLLNVLKNNVSLAPINPHLILPEIKDSRLWPDGRIPFLDEG